MSTFVFFHVGDDLTWPQRMVNSVLAHNPGAEIIQVTDHHTPTANGVTWTAPTTGDPRYLMQWRVDAFASLGLDTPALYLDTDMIVKRPISPDALLKTGSLAVCRRSFNRDNTFNPRQRGLDFSEYAGKTLDQVYPIVGCATVTKNSDVWEDLAEMYNVLPEKFRAWYGDQEVLREYCRHRAHDELPENIYACLPEFAAQHHPSILHYKGLRKAHYVNGDARAG